MLIQFISVFLVTLGVTNAQSCPGGYGTGEEGDPGAHNLHYDPEIWTFLFFSGTPTRQIYPSPVTNQWSGYYVDVINEVCKIAGKNCVLTAGEFENCWANNNPQVALMGRWADACVSYSHSSARARAVEFSHAFSPAPVPVLVTRRGNPRGVNPDNLSGLRIGFLRNWWADDFCLNSATGDRLGEDQIVFYDEDEDLVSIIAAADRGDVDAVFISNDLVDTVSGTLEVVRVFDSCLLGGESLMMRKDSLLKSWFDPALERLVHSRVYREICDDIDDHRVHGELPGKTAAEICFPH